jgi:hypothetical protein
MVTPPPTSSRREEADGRTAADCQSSTPPRPRDFKGRHQRPGSRFRGVPDRVIAFVESRRLNSAAIRKTGSLSLRMAQGTHHDDSNIVLNVNGIEVIYNHVIPVEGRH